MLRWHVLILCGLCVFSSGCAPLTAATSLVPTQLKGLRGINLIVFVNDDVPEYDHVERHLRRTVSDALVKGGLRVDDSFDTVLSVDVQTYPSARTMAMDKLVGARIELKEQVRLVRDPKVRFPGGNGAVTWSDSWLSLESTSGLAEEILRQVGGMAEGFAAEVRSVNKTR